MNPIQIPAALTVVGSPDHATGQERSGAALPDVGPMASLRPGFPGLSDLFTGSPKGNRTPVDAVRGSIHGIHVHGPQQG
jgi:hypothetical protein